MSFNCDNMWDLYMNGDYNTTDNDNKNDINISENIRPVCSDIYISTRISGSASGGRDSFQIPAWLFCTSTASIMLDAQV